MRPEIKRMNERLGYFLNEMDLANARVNHAEEEIERLKEENNELTKEIDKLKRENGRLEVSLKWTKEGYEAIKEDNEKLEVKLASREKLLISKLSPAPTCKCGKLAEYIFFSTHYCLECATKIFVT